jgi:hypothetical protein
MAVLESDGSRSAKFFLTANTSRADMHVFTGKTTRF